MSFQDIKGQDRPIEIIRESIRQSRLTGSYLFVGPEGVGKKLVAKTLAKTLNCEKQSLGPSTSSLDFARDDPERVKRVEGSLRVNGESFDVAQDASKDAERVEARSRTIDSCDSCPSCLKIEKNQHPDVYLIDASTPLNIDLGKSETDTADSNAIKIGHIRQLKKNISLKPYEARQKVFIIDNAHYLTAAASNAFLKILEEPTINTLIILLSAKPTLLFRTIISRCRALRFLPLKRPDLENILSKDYSLDRSLAHFLAYFCEGRLGAALGLKDMDIMQERNRTIEQLVNSRETTLDSFLLQDKEHLRRYLNLLAGWFRDMYLIKIGVPYQELINFDQRPQLLKYIQRFSFMDLDEILKCIANSLFYLEQNINIKLLLFNLKSQIHRQ